MIKLKYKKIEGCEQSTMHNKNIRCNPTYQTLNGNPNPGTRVFAELTVAPQVLAQGSSPLDYLSDHVTKYVSCVKDKAKEGCDVILNPPKKTKAKKTTSEGRWLKLPRPIEHYI